MFAVGESMSSDEPTSPHGSGVFMVGNNYITGTNVNDNEDFEEIRLGE